MAIAPPFDTIVNKPGAAVNKLQTALNKIISKINEKVSETVSKANKLPKDINCNDPRIRELKQNLLQIQTLIGQIQRVLRILNITIPILTATARIASVALNAQLFVPAPTPPAANQAIAVQNQLIANIIACLKQAGIIITIVNGSLTLVSALLAPVINKLSSICNTEIFDVSTTTQDAIDSLNTEIVNVQSESEFYQLINVSLEDIQSRRTSIDELEQQQRSLLDLLEAPSKVIIAQTPGEPDDTIGKSGDYFIDTTNNIIYGPKNSDFEWSTAVNY